MLARTSARRPAARDALSHRGRFRRRRQPALTATDALVERIRSSVIGDDTVLDGPFGPRRLVYADYTASGRSLSFIEDFIRSHALPLYANTHTEASGTGLQTTALREDARRIIHRAVNGGEDDVVVFCGSGTTGAIDKLMRLLGVGQPTGSSAIPADQRPIVFIGPYEHHSNELPWRESIADVGTIREDADGRVDIAHLEAELERHAARSLKIGSFSAASIVTGIVTDVERIAIALHRHGALACFDYGAAGPYLPIDMNPSPPVPDGHLAYTDAVYLAPHKFVGGPGTPGILVAKRPLFGRCVPTTPGGGTILFVSPTRQSYHPDPAIREEAGTPAIVESIRAGLVFALKEAVGADEIRRRENDFGRRALASWDANPNIEILGNPRLERLAIASLGLRHERGLLHSNFVVSLLSDLFGIQARSGCFCAGPYIHRMYPIDDDWSAGMDAQCDSGRMGAKLAFVRVGFPYFFSETVFEYIVDAIHMVANHGWKLLPLYRFDPDTGLWHHASGRLRPPLALHDLSFTADPERPHASEPEGVLARQLEQARRIIAEIEAAPPAATDPVLTPEFERIRWFPLPGEALAQLRDCSCTSVQSRNMAAPDNFRAESRRRWDAQAAGWESRRDSLRASTLPVSAWMIDAIDPQPGDTLLELAAGTGDTGLLAAELIEPGGTLICSDFAPEMLATARRRADELGIGNVRFKQIDADTSIDVETAGIDGVLCRWGYMLMADPENALRETRRVLRPGARVALAAWADPEDNPWSSLPDSELVASGLTDPRPTDGPGQFAWAREGIIAEHLEAAGFGEHHVEALEFTYDFHSAADWWAAQCEYSVWFTEAVERAGDADLAAVSDAVDRHAQRFVAPDGTLRIPARTWIAWATA